MSERGRISSEEGKIVDVVWFIVIMIIITGVRFLGFGLLKRRRWDVDGDSGDIGDAAINQHREPPPSSSLSH